MPDPLNLVPHAVAQEHDPTFMGIVAAPAPRMPDQDLNVKLSWNPLTSIRVPAGSWAPIHGPVMPREGDSAVVHVDDQRFVRCVWWGPSAVAAPASDSTARAYVTFAAQTGTGLNLVPLDTLHADNGQNLDLTQSQYVVPHDGIYRVSGHVQLAVPSAGTLESYLSVFKNGEEQSHGEHKTAYGPSAVIGNTTAGGDLAGSYPNPTVAQIQTRPVSVSAPSSNQGLVWDGSSWSPVTVLGAANNLSDITSAAIARTNLGLPDGSGNAPFPQLPSSRQIRMSCGYIDGVNAVIGWAGTNDWTVTFTATGHYTVHNAAWPATLCPIVTPAGAANTVVADIVSSVAGSFSVSLFNALTGTDNDTFLFFVVYY